MKVVGSKPSHCKEMGLSWHSTCQAPWHKADSSRLQR